MKRLTLLLLAGSLFFFPALAHAQLDKILEDILGVKGQNINPKDLKVTKLELIPDPVREGQRPVFKATISNNSANTGRVTMAVRDKDRVISEARVVLKPGDNAVDFPETNYRFSQSNPCFTVEADIDNTRTPIDVEREFCAQKAQAGWTLTGQGVISLVLEHFGMYPDPASPGQEIRFTARIRNEGRPIRGHLQVQDRDQVIARIDNATIPAGSSEFQFPRMQYSFKSLDVCFTVTVSVERALYTAVDRKNTWCATPATWTVKPATKK